MATNVTDPPELASAARRSSNDRHRTLASIALGVLLLGGTLASLPAAGGQRLCAQRTLTARDLAAAHGAAARALRDLAPLAATVGVFCRNPLRADAWFESTRRQDPDGVREWYDVQCNRDTESWSCEAPTHQREFELDVPTRGGLRHAIVSLDPTNDVTVARQNAALAVRALDEIRMPLPSGCAPAPDGPLVPGPSDAAAGVAPFPQPLNLAVWANDGIQVGGWPQPLFIQFRKDPAASSRLLVCWNELIVVA